MKKPRIISLLASSTEIVCDLGLESCLVGISHECDYPASIRHLPVCTAPKFDAHASSPAIDLSVRTLVERGASVYRVDTDLLESLRPDYIITQSQCEVCAVSYREVERAVCQLISSRPQLINLEPNALADVFADIQRAADALDVPDRGRQLTTQMHQRLTVVQETWQHLAPSNKPTVATIEWLHPLMYAANWVPELIALAGGTNLFGQAGQHSHYFSWEELRTADPDVVVVMPCGFDIARTRQELPLLTQLPGFDQLRAVRQRRFFLTDGNAYFNRPGPRLADSVEILAELFYPERFAPAHPAAYEPLEMVSA